MSLRTASACGLLLAVLASTGCNNNHPNQPNHHVPQGGRVGGPGHRVVRVNAFATDAFYEDFRAGAPAIVTICGDGDTDLDVFIFDSNGNLIVQAIGPTDRETVSWTPRWTGRFRIEVRNLGPVWNQYSISTN